MQQHPLAAPTPSWLQPVPDRALRWAVAAGLFLATLALRLAVPTTGAVYPFLAFFPAVLLSAWIAGAAASGLVTLASAAACWWFLMRGPGLLRWPDPGEAAALAGFVATGGLTGVLVGGLTASAVRAASARAEAEQEVAAQRIGAAELQHRVANNLQLMASILNLQARGQAGTAAAIPLREAMRRLEALGRLHRLLLTTGARTDAAGALAAFCRTQMEVSGRANVALETRLATGIILDAARLQMLGMIASEAISNALRHGLADRDQGRITVTLRTVGDDRAELEVRDDGAGLPPRFAGPRDAGLGLRIMQSQAEAMGGTLSLGDEGGARLRVTFPYP